jgi:hypothetical protein
MNLFLITMSRSIKKINPKATMSYSFIRGLQFYEVKSDITFYVGIFVNYLIIGTKKEQISKLLYNLIIRSRTNFINSLQAPNFSKPLLDRFTFNVFVNLQKVFENSILPQLAIEQGVKLHGLKNLFLNVNIRDNAVHSVLNLYFK